MIYANRNHRYSRFLNKLIERSMNRNILVSFLFNEEEFNGKLINDIYSE